MIENYLELMHFTLEDMKDYLEEISSSEEVEDCFLERQVKAFVEKHKKEYLAYALTALMNAQGASEMEYHFVMINYFFHGEEVVEKMKAALKPLILATQKPIAIYRLLRHVMDLDCTSLIDALYQAGYLTLQQAAYLCLVEKNIDLAYTYLMACDTMPKEALLDYFHSYSTTGYYALKKHFKKSAKLSLSLGTY